MVLSEKKWYLCGVVELLFSYLVGSNDYPRPANQPTKQPTNKTKQQNN